MRNALLQGWGLPSWGRSGLGLAGGLALCLVLSRLASLSAEAGEVVHVPVKTWVKTTETGHVLMRGGMPYLIKGAGGDQELKILAEAGGNSIRTWGAEKLGEVLDAAHAKGITVTAGIWLGHERHGFDYNNADQVAEQYAQARETIQRFRHHPALLMWGIGNEMEGYEAGDNAAIWSAINNIASLAHQLDPNHPTMTVVAEVGGDRVKNIHRLCPDIDVVGINSYGGVTSLPERYKQAGGSKPYVITEFGPPGIWEVQKTEWGAPPELTSTEKAGLYAKAYENAVLAQPDACLGSYVFAWGHKQEATATWFGLFLPDGSRLGAVDTMTKLWSGKPPVNLCPDIKSLQLRGADQVDPGSTVTASLAAEDPEGDPLKVEWLLFPEATSYGTGGDAEAALDVIPDAIIKADAKSVEVKMPKDGGGYRLFAYVRDDHGGAAVGNIPLRVKGPVRIPEGRRTDLPLVLFDEPREQKFPYIPAGYMGNTKAIRMDDKWTEDPHSGKVCIRADFQAKEGWGGVVWQSPAGDWGDQAGGWNVSGAKQLSFWARGETGNEVVNFSFGLIGKDKRFSDTASGKLDSVKLTTEWQQFKISLTDQDLKRIKTGFVWVVASKGSSTTFYLDDIQFE